jgi:hypothetical protein
LLVRIQPRYQIIHKAQAGFCAFLSYQFCLLAAEPGLEVSSDKHGKQDNEYEVDVANNCGWVWVLATLVMPKVSD